MQDNFTKLNIENEKNISIIKKLNSTLDELNTNVLLFDENFNNIKLQNQKLKKDNRIFFAKNLKLESSITNLKGKIIEQKTELDLYIKQIKELKDKSHHGD